MRVNEFDDDYLPLARIDDDMLLCLHTAAANASDVLPPPKIYKDINGRPDEEGWRAACIEEFKGKVANNTFDLVKRPRILSSARPSGFSPTSSTTTALSNDAKRAGYSAATVNDL
eukprot:5881799-Pleurochrysis_carterae.AAC.1